MLRWLGRSPESFLERASSYDQRFDLPDAGPDRRLRWALKLLYATMNDKRQELASVATWLADWSQPVRRRRHGRRKR
jgi:hypothetical protein